MTGCLPPGSSTTVPTAPISSQSKERRREKAKNTRIEVWRAEVDPSDLICGCSGPEVKPDSSQPILPEVCSNCHSSLPSLQQSVHRRELKMGFKKVFGRLMGSRHHDGPRHATTQQGGDYAQLDPDTNNAAQTSEPVPAAGPSTSQVSTRPPRPPPQNPDVSTNGTEMYRHDRHGPGDGASDSASVPSPLGGLSDSDDGRGRPKLTIDHTAARLRRAQKLLHAKASGQERG
ncbi:hypothetical protein BJ170DRAFT_597137 [Xylariales sp. AK1849]|nr:hypothetical protein BJ170DRAFT_597137 [Xylariales sp. AK1849]